MPGKLLYGRAFCRCFFFVATSRGNAPWGKLGICGFKASRSMERENNRVDIIPPLCFFVLWFPLRNDGSNPWGMFRPQTDGTFRSASPAFFVPFWANM